MSHLDEEIAHANKLALGLVDHLFNMGGASSCMIPVVDRAEEYAVIVIPKAVFDKGDFSKIPGAPQSSAPSKSLTSNQLERLTSLENYARARRDASPPNSLDVGHWINVLSFITLITRDQ